ncbi:glycosyl hydrolase family 16 [Frondihabitans sp. PhB188]|uniref:glycoside hydrolase family 16 protein n=1 Tax=Frondihabitans sp. PhB188 TaxID=2485200 RepID=UPI000F474142|nr:glycoside hydrolase family 16 protein [Frondihabitans sp. PhB188]ROQ40015.1 glycosyl hydrolase family 16 [Frondihabitans sp. PhB188]
MTFSLRLAAAAVVTVSGLVGIGMLDAPGASAESSVTVPTEAGAKALSATYESKQAASVKAASAYATKSAAAAKSRATYLAKAKASTASQSRLKVVLTSSTYSASYKATAKKNSAVTVKATASAKTAYSAAKAIAAKYKALAASAAAAAAAAQKAVAATQGGLVAMGSGDAAMPTGSVTSNGRTWRQSYAEDFTTPAALGTVLTTYPRMEAYDGFDDTSGQGLYAPDRVLSVSNSNLDFFLHSEKGQPLVAAVMPDGYTPHTTGRVSIRYRSDDILGYKFVGMFWPSSDDWNDGEIDWPEADLGANPRPASAVPGSLRNGGMTFKPAVETFAATDQSEYHVATTEWDHDAIRYYWDGELVSTVTDAVPATAMRVTLQAETFIGEGTVPKTTAGHLDIDWISIWD